MNGENLRGHVKTEPLQFLTNSTKNYANTLLNLSACNRDPDDIWMHNSITRCLGPVDKFTHPQAD